MPLVRSETTGEASAWGLWQITETEEELSYAALESCPEEIISPAKRKEFLAGRALVKALVEKVGFQYSGIRKDEQGKPYLRDQHHEISLSHSSPYVAAQVDAKAPVGIDIEQPKEKLLRIAPRMLSEQEQKDAGDDIVKHCVYWCAKEAMYKLYGKRGLHFHNELNIDPFTLKRSGELRGYIKSDIIVALGYIIKDDYVLVYTKVS
jgi:phosphopantetheinyl transferase